MTENQFETGLDFAQKADSTDKLAHFRDQFHIPKTTGGSEAIYFCGNSLGLQPKSTRAFIEQELKDWENLGVEGHFQAKNPWMPYHEFLSESTARLVGARPDEVVVMGSLTANLHFLMVSFYRPTATRYKILIEEHAFPSDRYAVESQLRFHGFDPSDALVLMASETGEPFIPTEEIERMFQKEGDSIALVLMGGVNYYSGQAFQMKRVTSAAHAKGCVVGFDLAHAVGNLKLSLHDWGVDFAAWCSYKYLNSGPGGVAGAFVHQKHATENLPRFAGWWGHDKNTRFKMGPQFVPIPGAEGWQLSNAPVLAMACLRASMTIFDEAGMENLMAKSSKMADYFIFLLNNQKVRDLEISLITPSHPDHRGCQLSLRTGINGKALFDRLSRAGVICDWREPDVIRVAPVPLYNRFEEIWQFVEILSRP